MSGFSFQPQQSSSGGYSRWKKRGVPLIALVLVGIIVALGVSYGLSYQSARGLTVELVQISRSYNPGPYLATIQFDVTAHVWSTNSLDMSIDRVQFQLTVDGIPFPSVSARGSTFSPRSYLEYNLRFSDTNSQDAALLGERSNSRVTLSVATEAIAGIYSGSLSPSTSRTISISRVVEERIAPTVVNECQAISRDILLSQRGGVTITLSSSPDTLLVTINNSQGTSILNQESTSSDASMRLPADSYSVQVQNPGFLCTGANDQVSGSIEFWREQTNLD